VGRILRGLILLRDEVSSEAANSAEHPMNFLLAEDFSFSFPRAGELREGQVVANLNNTVLIDIGAKSEGIILNSEVESLDSAMREKLAVGNSVPVIVVDPENQDGNMILSYVKAVEEEDWAMAQSYLESQDTYETAIIGFNKGGLLVQFGTIRGFVPMSLLGPQRRSNVSRLSPEEQLRSNINEKLIARVIEVDRSRNRLILSERAAQKEIRAAERANLLSELQIDEVREGKVVNLADFGAFVDIGGLEGLVHVSEMSWQRIGHPSEVLDVGDVIQVMIIKVDLDRGRVALSIKRLEDDPWTSIEERYKEGDLVEVTITKLTKYGAFAHINDDFALEGLIHISEISEDRTVEPEDVLDSGQIVAARIIRVDAEQRQLGLSMKRVASDQFVEADLAMARDQD
jgi:small subunit ribosomal protein S1